MRFSYCPEIMKICQNIQKSWDFSRNYEKPSKWLKIMKAMRLSHYPEIMKNRQKFENHEISHCSEIMKNRQCFKIIRFSHCPEIIKKSWYFPRNHEKLSKVLKNHEIFTLPRNHENMSKYSKIVRFFQKSWKTVKVVKNHESNETFTLPRNHEKPSKILKIMRFSHCSEIIKKPSVF